MLKRSKNRLVASLLTLALVLFTISSFSPSLFANELDNHDISYDENNNPYRTGQLIVAYRGNSTAEEKRSVRANLQLELKANLNNINAEVVNIKNEKARDVLANLKNNPNVLYAEYDYLASINHVPNDQRYPYQVYLHYMNAENAWDYSKGNPNITVAVLDSGILTSNTDLNSMSYSGYNVADGNSVLTDNDGHGTGVTSVIAAKMDNTFGFAGVAPESSFMIIKVVDSQGYSTYSDLIQGLEYASQQGAHVINMSVSGRSDSLSLKMAVDNAYNSGITIVAAAGNEASTSISYPAAYDNVVGVGAVSTNGDKMTFSNTGVGITVVAGGTAMIATSTDYITSASGTSFASPYVTGLVALLYAVDENMTPSRVFEILESTSTDLGAPGYDTTFGYGVINMGEAVTMAADFSTPTVDVLAPVVTLNGSANLELEVGSNYIEEGAKAIDNVDGDISNTITITGTVDTNLAGLYTLTYSATDQAGNLSEPAVRTIEVIEVLPEPDTVAPEITLNGDTTIILEQGQTYTEPGASAFDNVDGDISDLIVISGQVDVTTPGIYQLTYTVSDQASNTTSIERTIEILEDIPVVDTVSPVLTLLGDSQISLEIGTSYEEPGYEAIDDIDGDITNQVSIAGTVDINTPGLYTLDYIVVDEAGNQSNIETRTIEIYELVEIPEETVIIRDVEVVTGSLSKRNPETIHNISIIEAGQLDVEVSYTGKNSPLVSINGDELTNDSGVFNLNTGDYEMFIKANSNVKYTITLTYPEREVPANVPLGPPTRVTYYEQMTMLLYITAIAIILTVIATLYIYRKKKHQHE